MTLCEIGQEIDWDSAELERLTSRTGAVKMYRKYNVNSLERIKMRLSGYGNRIDVEKERLPDCKFHSTVIANLRDKVVKLSAKYNICEVWMADRR